MKLTKQEKTELREIFRRAQDCLSMKETSWQDRGISEFCCFAIDIAEGNTFGMGDVKGTLAYEYFCHLFKEASFSSAWPFGDTQNNEIDDKSQDRRLMALQLCELSLT
jgi:hypothetical protein